MRARHVKTILLGFAAAVLLSQGPAAAAPLLEGFEYGTPRTEIEARPGAVKGEADYKDDVFLKGVQWAGLAWTGQCHFKDGRLVGVSLYSAWSRDLLNRVSAYLKERQFHMLGLIVDDTALDIINLVKLGGMEAFQKRYRELVTAKVPQRISYEWFDVQRLPQEQFMDATSLGQLLTLVPQDTLQVDVTQSASGEKLENGRLSVHFSFPVMDEMVK